MAPGALFVFDVNTPYKHREILADNTFVYDTGDVYCVWQNSLDEKTDTVHISLDFFERSGSLYRRSCEHFSERAYSLDHLSAMLEQAGLKVLAVYNDLTTEAPGETCQRAVFVAKKSE